MQYCPKAYKYSGGNTSSMLQHFRGAHRDRADITQNFPAFPEKSKGAKKRELVQGLVIEEIENLRPMPPDKKVSVKMTNFISDSCSLNSRTLDMVNAYDIGFIRLMAGQHFCQRREQDKGDIRNEKESNGFYS